MENHTPEADIFVFNGVVYRRYPASKHANKRKYYWPSPHLAKKGYGALHVEIWKSAHGDIPPGWHVHHRDGNPLNNALENLECVSPGDHIRIHMLEPERIERSREQCHRMRPLAYKWRGSEEGREYYRRRAKKAWECREPVERQCEQCGATYSTLKIDVSQSRFCSAKCQSKARRDSGVDNEQRVCAVCGLAFECNRYESTRCCSRQCGRKSRGLSRDATH